MTFITRPVPQARLDELRRIADTIRHSEDLLLLNMFWGLRNVQEANIDMVVGGDFAADEVPQDMGLMMEAAADMVDDVMVDLLRVGQANRDSLGDYTVTFETKIIAKTKI